MNRGNKPIFFPDAFESCSGVHSIPFLIWMGEKQVGGGGSATAYLAFVKQFGSLTDRPQRGMHVSAHVDGLLMEVANCDLPSGPIVLAVQTDSALAASPASLDGRKAEREELIVMFAKRIFGSYEAFPKPLS